MKPKILVKFSQVFVRELIFSDFTGKNGVKRYNISIKIMKVDDIDISQQEIENIKVAVQTRQPVDFFCYSLTPDQKIRFQKILSVFLEECNQSHLYNYLSYCLFELLDNASKANAKRIFFKEKNLNIENDSDYKEGMNGFKADLSEHAEHYLEELKLGQLKVHLLLSANDVITITVANNTKITDSEFLRIKEKIDKTKNYANLQDAVSDIDQTEGSGLGIITVIIMLKKLGLTPNNLTFNITENETVATIEIPKDAMEEV